MRVLLADDHHLFLEGLRILLTGEGIEVVGLAHDGFEALHQAHCLHPDLILMDVKMPRCNGVEATRLIKAEMPECKIVMLSMSEDEDDLFEAIKNGACGYLLKHVKAENLFGYLRDTEAGRAVFSDGIAARILDEFKRAPSRPHPSRSPQQPDCNGRSPLSADQATILQLISEGQTYRQVAESVGISERTVKYHMGEILGRLHLENRAQAISYAAEMRRARPDGAPGSG
jgi:DNA-binding NarL/FixJ family response regulator